jgi:hypothetical protein
MFNWKNKLECLSISGIHEQGQKRTHKKGQLNVLHSERLYPYQRILDRTKMLDMYQGNLNEGESLV